MAYLVTNIFVCKETGRTFPAGSFYDGTDKKRIAELSGAGVIKVEGGVEDGQPKRKRAVAKSKDSPAAEA